LSPHLACASRYLQEPVQLLQMVGCFEETVCACSGFKSCRLAEKCRDDLLLKEFLCVHDAPSHLQFGCGLLLKSFVFYTFKFLQEHTMVSLTASSGKTTPELARVRSLFQENCTSVLKHASQIEEPMAACREFIDFGFNGQPSNLFITKFQFIVFHGLTTEEFVQILCVRDATSLTVNPSVDFKHYQCSNGRADKTKPPLW